MQKLVSVKPKLEGVKRDIEKSGRKYYAPNNAIAVMVKGQDDKFPVYNLQVRVEPKGHLIMTDRFTTDTNDM